MQKSIRKITPRAFETKIPGLTGIDMFHYEFDFEPFLVFTEFHMSRSFFGPHPHAGVSVMTYMLPDSQGSFLNRDSQGDHSIIEPGGVHVTQTGRGIKHDEVPTVNGVDCHGFQIWINHADKDRFIEPRAFHASSKDIPEYKTESVLIRVVQGKYGELESPIELVTKTSLFDITLQPHASIELDAKEMAFIYLMKGILNIDDSVIQGTAMVSFEKNGDRIFVKAGSAEANFIFASGTPHNEPIVHGGPFVMTSQEQMRITQQRLQRGEMGDLYPL